MKKIIILTLAPIVLLAQSQNGRSIDQTDLATSTYLTTDDGVGWMKDYDEAISDAKKKKRNILVYFTGSDWCPPCKMLQKDLFDTKAFKEISSNYTLLYIDIPRNRDLISAQQMKHNAILLKKINKKNVFPLLVVLNKKGLKLDQYSGYSMSGETKYHLDLLKKYR